jgi:hypothetical protein
MPQNLESFYHLILYVTMVSGDGRPFSGHVATAASIALDKNFTSKASLGVSASS